MSDTKRASRIKKIFKDFDDIRKDAVVHAKKNLEETKKIRKKKHHINHSKRGWARRLFYGPGTMWGAGGSPNTDNDGPDGDGDADDAGSSSTGDSGGSGGASGGDGGGA